MSETAQKKSKIVTPKVAIVPPPTRLDFGCGPNPKEGFEGVDQYAFGEKVKHVMDVRCDGWPWKDDSVDEVHASHFVEHLDAQERVRFFNELFRVMKPGAKATVITPHWASTRAYGDPTHKWPPVCEMGWYYLKRVWRLGDPNATPPVPANAPHTDISVNPDGYSCDFEVTWGYSLHQSLLPRNQDYQMHAMTFFKEACQDMIATLTKPVPKVEMK